MKALKDLFRAPRMFFPDMLGFRRNGQPLSSKRFSPAVSRPIGTLDFPQGELPYSGGSTRSASLDR
jgi:hypothetical protein